MSIYRLGFVSAIFIGLLSYFLFHTIYGNRGIISKKTIEASIVKSSEELEKIRSNRIELEHKVKLLRPESLDKDMLEEEARSTLGIAKNDEEVVVTEQQKNEK